MKKKLFIILLSLSLTIVPTLQSHAVVWVVITTIIKKVIKAMDLAIQRLQNKTIWLQEAQKQLENSMSKLQLDKITSWADKQKQLYAGYYDELARVKNTIALYSRIRTITAKQLDMIGTYKKTWTLFINDKNFTSAEITYMEQVYTGILDESVRNLDLIFTIVHSFSLTMTDGKRLELIDAAAENLEHNAADLAQFNRQNKSLSLSRAKDQREINTLKTLYGL